jgi:CheY-like chemotaxis protein
VSLDVFLPDMLGWTVLSQLKQNPLTRHIPSRSSRSTRIASTRLARGAFSFVTKPTTTEGVDAALTRIKEYASPRRKRLLVVEDNEAEHMSIASAGLRRHSRSVHTGTGEEALHPPASSRCDLRRSRPFGLPDYDGLRLCSEQFREDAFAVECAGGWWFHGAGSVARRRTRSCTRWRAASWLKASNRPERLLDETSFSSIRHRAPELPQEKQRMLDRLTAPTRIWWQKVLAGPTTTRATIFALSSVLKAAACTLLTATTGREAIALLESTSDVAIVLMDIMMPEMDGYQTMEVIRKKAEFRRLPIIALTAKAMKGDREKCLEAGASDYLAKPVNTEQLLSALRMWLHR